MGQEHDLEFFEVCGCVGGSSRSPKKLEAARKNLAKANAARLAAQARRQQDAAAASAQSQEPAPPRAGHQAISFPIELTAKTRSWTANAADAEGR